MAPPHSKSCQPVIESFLFLLTYIQLLLILKCFSTLSFSLHTKCCCLSSIPDVCPNSLWISFIKFSAYSVYFQVATTEVYQNENVITSLLCFKPSRKHTVFYRTQTESLLCIEITFVRWLTWNIFTSFTFLPKCFTSSDALNTFEFHEDPR